MSRLTGPNINKNLNPNHVFISYYNNIIISFYLSLKNIDKVKKYTLGLF